MTTAQLAQALLIAVVTAFATAVLAHWLGLRRLRETWKQEEREREVQWKREMRERVAYYKRQQLEETLAVVKALIDDVLRVMGDMTAHVERKGRFAPRGLEALHKMGMKLLRAHSPGQVAALTVRDQELNRRLDRFNKAVGKAFIEGVEKMTEEEWLSRVQELQLGSAMVLARCDELVEEAYAEAMAHE